MLQLPNLNPLNTQRRRAIFITSFILGVFVVIQSRSFDGLTQINTRDSASNTFRELQVLRDTNRNLQGETVSLQDLLEKTKDSSSSLKVLEQEIRKFEVINGNQKIKGPGIIVHVPDHTELASLIDLTNELFNTGAEAVSVNGVRLIGNSFGFDAIPNGQVLMNGMILEPPYTFSAIGDSTVLENSLRQAGGIVQRYDRKHPGKTLKIEKKDRIDIDKV